MPEPEPARTTEGERIASNVPMTCGERHYGDGPHRHQGCFMIVDTTALASSIDAALAAQLREAHAALKQNEFTWRHVQPALDAALKREYDLRAQLQRLAPTGGDPRQEKIRLEIRQRVASLDGMFASWRSAFAEADDQMIGMWRDWLHGWLVGALQQCGVPAKLAYLNQAPASERRGIAPTGVELREEIDALRQAKDGAYAERDRLVAALSKLFPAALERHPDADSTWEDDWRWIVFVDLPTGQATWHIHDSELGMFDHLPRFTGRTWDGHTTEEKYARVGQLAPASERSEAIPPPPGPATEPGRTPSVPDTEGGER